MRTLIFLTLTSILLATSLFAKIIRVPEDFAKIQDAINQANNGDTVLVAPGVYLEGLTLDSKQIVLASHYLTSGEEAYIQATILYKEANGSSNIYCKNIADTSTVITGFTIGSTHFECTGIYCDGASPLIRNNIFQVVAHAGIWTIGHSHPVIRNNIFQFEQADVQAAGINAIDGFLQIGNNSFTDLDSLNSTAIKINNNASAYISANRINFFRHGIENYGYNTTIVNNLVSGCYYGIISTQALILNNTIVQNLFGITARWTIPEVKNCIVWKNYIDFNGTFTISNSCMHDCLPWNAIDKGGNIFRDPQFVDPQNGDFHLKGYSPCIDAGISTAADSIPAYDLDGHLRIQDGTGEGQAVIDMGCYERAQATNPAFVSGRITLSGGNGHVEDAWVGVGTMVHPDADGNYIFAISAPDSVYTVTAMLDSYLTQQIENVPIQAENTTSDINFTLSYYHPSELLEVNPDTIKFLTWEDGYQKTVWLKNISLTDICIRWIGTKEEFGFFTVDRPDSFPRKIAAGDSTSFTIINVMVLTKNRLFKTSEFETDSLMVYFNDDSLLIPIIYNPDLFGAIEKKPGISRNFELFRNYPNPFNARTTITFEIAQKSRIALTIYNIAGQKVRSLIDKDCNPGSHSLVWDGKNDLGQELPSGLYFGILQSSKKKKTIKMIMLK